MNDVPMRRGVALGLAFLLAVAALLAAAPASAHHSYWARGGGSLTANFSNLNGLEIEIGLGGSTTAFSAGFGGHQGVTLSGAPASVTNLRVCGGGTPSQTGNFNGYTADQRGWMRICHDGYFYEDWQLSIRLERQSQNSYFNGDSSYTFGPIAVRAQNTLSTLALSDSSISENGGVATVTATLSQAQSAPVTITVGTTPFADTGMQASDYNVSSNNVLTIAAGSTTSTGTVTITAVDNAVTAAAKTMRIFGTISGGDGAGPRPPARLYLRITDDETSASATATPTLALSSSSIAENGGSATVTATLDQSVSTQVRVWVYAAAGSGAFPANFSLSGAGPLTIAAGSTTSTGTVTITAVDNATWDSSKTVRVYGQARGGNTPNPADVTLTVTDDETRPTATLALSASTIDETGSSNSATVTATLSGPASEATTLTVAAGTGATVSSTNTLTIAARETASTGTVTVTAVSDTTDSPDKRVAVSATASGGKGVANPANVTLTITDDDDAPDVTLTLSDASIAENGGTSTVSATLNNASSEATTVTVTAVSGAFTVPTGAGGRIVIAAGSTTSTDTVTITAANNAVHSGDRTATVTATVANAHATGSVTGVSLTLEEDESAPTVTLAASPASVSENGGTAQVSATLSGASSAATTVTVTAAATGSPYTIPSGAGAADIVIAAGSTTSTDRVTVTAVNNDVDAADNAATVTGTASNSAGVGTVTGASLTFTDDDTAGLVVVPTTSASSRLQTREDGSQATFTVKLATRPTGTVVLDVQSSDTAQGTVSASSLTFSTTTWNTAQTVTVTGVDDSPGTADGSQAYTVSVGSNLGMTQDANYNGLSAVTVYARNLDDEFGLDVGTVTGQATEAGGQATFTVALLTQPTAAVTVAVSSRDGSEGRVSPSSLTFTTTDWSTDQTVTVTGLDDEVEDGNVSWDVRLDPSSPPPGGDTDYHALANVDVSVTTQDDDTAGLAVSPTTSTPSRLQTTEAGGRATFTVRLTSEPTGSVVLDVASTDTGEGTVSPSSLTFTASDWETTRTVTVTGANDDVDDGDQAYTVTLTVDQASTADSSYDGLTAVTVYAENVDDDTAGLAVSPSTSATTRLRTSEDGRQVELTVALASEPTGAVTVSVSSTDTGQGTVSSSSLTFSTTTWSTAQTVTVTGVNDSPGLPDGSQDYEVRLVTSSTVDAKYNGLGAVTVYARNLDDEAGVEVTLGSVAPLRTTEGGGTATFTVVLLSEPQADVVVPLLSTKPGEGVVSSGSLVFTPQNATTPQTVTVRGVDDPIDDGDAAYIIATGDPSSADDTYDGLGAGDVDDVSVVNEDDDDAPSVSLSVSPSSISESGGEARVAAALSHPSVAWTRVTVSESAQYTLSSTAVTLVIPARATHSPETVTVRAVDDAVDTPDRTVTVTGTAVNGMGVGTVTGAVLRLEDDDEAGLAFARAGVSGFARERVVEVDAGAEGATYTVALTSEPTGVVTVGIGSDNADVVVSPSSLSFTAADWAEARAVRVSARADADDVADVAALAHAARGGGYDGVSGTVSVAVAEAGDTGLAAPSPGTTRTYRVGGRRIEVETASASGAGDEAGYRAAVEGLVLTRYEVVGDAPGSVLRLTVAPVSDELGLERGAFGFGPLEASDRVVLDIDAVGLRLDFCLGVSGGLRDAARGSALVLLRHDGSGWSVVSGSGEDGDGRVCVSGVDAFSPFAVGWENEVPSWAGVESLRLGPYAAGAALPEDVGLPAAAGVGDAPVGYELAGRGGAPLPEWLTFDASGAGCAGAVERALCGVPPVGVDGATLAFTLVAIDRHGDRTEPGLAVEVVLEGDSAPTFGGATVLDRVYTLEEAVEALRLPEARGGNGALEYTLAPALPRGLVLDADGAGACGAARTVCGTPVEVRGRTLYTWSARDRDGDETAPPVRFTVAVEGGAGEARARLKAVNESILPELSRASWDSAMGAVAGRLESSSGEERLSAALAGFVRANEQALEEGVSWKELLGGRSFAVGLGGKGEGADVGREVTVWGAGDRRRLSRAVPSVGWSGVLSALHLGADVGLASGVTGGVGVSLFESVVDYEGRGAAGEHRSRMTSVQPYVGWSSQGARLWASMGYGEGEVEWVDEALVERYGRQRSGSELVAAAAGGSVRVVSSGAMRLDVKAQGQMTRYTVEDNGDLMEGVLVETRRVRMAAQGSREYVLAGGWSLSPSAQLGVRWDTGDGARGTGVEVGAGALWVGPDGGLTVDVGGRWLVAPGSGDVEEWGISGGVRVEPGPDGRGLSLSVAPGWGEASREGSRLWDAGASGVGEASREDAGAVLEAEMGYGVSAFGGFGVATPYTRYGQGGDEQRYGLGWRLSRGSGEGFELDVGTWRRQRDAARAEHGLGIDLRLSW